MSQPDRDRLQAARFGLTNLAEDCHSKKASDRFCLFLRLKHVNKNISNLNDEELSNIIIEIAIGEGHDKKLGKTRLFHAGLNSVESRIRIYERQFSDMFPRAPTHALPPLRPASRGRGGRGRGPSDQEELTRRLQMLRDNPRKSRGGRK